MKMKSVLSLALALFLGLSAVGCSKPESTTSQPSGGEAASSEVSESVLPADGPSFNLILAHGAPEGSDGDKATLLFKELIEARSGGKITVDSYPAFQLGSVAELIQNQKSGQIAITMGTAGGSTSRALSFLDLPAMYDDIEKATAVVQEGTKARALIDQEYGTVNTKVLSIMPIDYREVSTNVAVHNVDEFNGLDIRTMENPLHMKFWQAVGANPTPLPFSELYIALQQGLVDAQENPLDTIWNSKIWEQQKYVVNSHHVMFYNAYTINKDIWASMPESYQDLIMDTMTEVEAFHREAADTARVELRAKLEAEGVEFIDFTDADFAKMKELAAPVYDDARAVCGDEVMDEVISTMSN